MLGQMPKQIHHRGPQLLTQELYPCPRASNCSIREPLYFRRLTVPVDRPEIARKLKYTTQKVWKIILY